jgi:hypothetical protein
MNIGDELTWRGQRWRVRGVDPVSVLPHLVYLEDVESGRRVNVERQSLGQPGANAARDFTADWELHALE